MWSKCIKYVLILCCFISVGCQKNVTQSTVINTEQHIKRPFSKTTRIQLEIDIYGIGPKKSKIVFDELLSGGPFKSAQDFEERLTGKLSRKMIDRILKYYSF